MWSKRPTLSILCRRVTSQQMEPGENSWRPSIGTEGRIWERSKTMASCRGQSIRSPLTTPPATLIGKMFTRGGGASCLSCMRGRDGHMESLIACRRRRVYVRNLLVAAADNPRRCDSHEDVIPPTQFAPTALGSGSLRSWWRSRTSSTVRRLRPRIKQPEHSTQRTFQQSFTSEGMCSYRVNTSYEVPIP